jgi:hypothetical protein
MKRQKHPAVCSVGRGEALGRREFRKGAMRVPAFSRRARTALRHCKSPKATLAFLTAWVRGWDRENLRDSPRIHPGLSSARKRRRR